MNEFFTDHRQRFNEEGSHIKAALKLYASECFRIALSNPYINEQYVAEEFRVGIEGYPSLDNAGITLEYISGIDIYDFSTEDVQLLA